MNRPQIFLRMVTTTLWMVLVNSAFASCNVSGEVNPLIAISQSTDKLLQDREFSKLDRLADEYRKNNSLALDGRPKLIGFYSGLSNATANCMGLNESDDTWDRKRQLLLAWQKASPDVFTPKLALALFDKSYAWHARGSGYASTVTEDGWGLFQKRIVVAKEMLEKLGEDSGARNDPEWYAGMLDIGLAQGWHPQQFDALFAEAVKKFPFYYSLYYKKGDFHSGQWYGTQNEFQTFVEESVKATRQKLGLTMYTRLHVAKTHDSMFTDGQTDWEIMKIGFKRIVKDFPGSWNQNYYGKYSCMAGDVMTLREQLKKITSHEIPAAWGTIEFLNACKTYASTNT